MLTDIIKARHKINVILAVSCLVLILLLLLRIKSAFDDYYQKRDITQATKLNIVRTMADNSKQTLQFKKINQQWQMLEPQSNMASLVMLKTLLDNVAQCGSKYPAKDIKTNYYANISIDNYNYEIGERNPMTDQIYVKSGEQVMLCNKMIASIVQAPTVNFYDKALFEGKIIRIESSLAVIDDPKQLKLLSFDVAELAPINTKSIENNIVDEFFITSLVDNVKHEKKFSVVINDKQYLLLIDMKKQLAYAVLNQPLFKHLLGMDGKAISNNNASSNESNNKTTINNNNASGDKSNNKKAISNNKASNNESNSKTAISNNNVSDNESNSKKVENTNVKTTAFPITATQNPVVLTPKPMPVLPSSAISASKPMPELSIPDNSIPKHKAKSTSKSTK